jgi:hypothetical protein
MRIFSYFVVRKNDLLLQVSLLEELNFVFFISVFIEFIFYPQSECPSVYDLCGSINQTLILPAFKVVIFTWWQNIINRI